MFLSIILQRAGLLQLHSLDRAEATTIPKMKLEQTK